MTTDKDPQVHHPGRPDPAASSSDEAPQQPSDPGVKPELDTQNEADEPVENRFPKDDDGGEHRESG